MVFVHTFVYFILFHPSIKHFKLLGHEIVVYKLNFNCWPATLSHKFIKVHFVQTDSKISLTALRLNKKNMLSLENLKLDLAIWTALRICSKTHQLNAKKDEYSYLSYIHGEIVGGELSNNNIITNVLRRSHFSLFELLRIFLTCKLYF